MSTFNKSFVDVSGNSLRIMKAELGSIAETFVREAHPIAPAMQDAVLALDEFN